MECYRCRFYKNGFMSNECKLLGWENYRQDDNCKIINDDDEQSINNDIVNRNINFDYACDYGEFSAYIVFENEEIIIECDQISTILEICEKVNNELKLFKIIN